VPVPGRLSHRRFRVAADGFRRAAREVAGLAAILTLMTLLSASPPRPAAAAHSADCPLPGVAAAGVVAPTLSDFMKYNHLPPFLAFLHAVRHDDYREAERALCAILVATRTPQGRKMVTQEIDQETFEYLIEFRESVSRAHRFVHALADDREVSAATRTLLLDLTLEIGDSCHMCHVALGGPEGPGPVPRRRVAR
jgi:hypothetical protein